MLYVPTRSPATTRASPSTPGTAPVAAAPDHSVPRPAGPAHTPSRRAHRPGMSDIRSHRPPARTRPDLGQISAQARSRFAQVIVIVIDGGEEFARWWIELCCAPVELK